MSTGGRYRFAGSEESTRFRGVRSRTGKPSLQ